MGKTRASLVLFLLVLFDVCSLLAHAAPAPSSSQPQCSAAQPTTVPWSTATPQYHCNNVAASSSSSPPLLPRGVCLDQNTVSCCAGIPSTSSSAMGVALWCNASLQLLSLSNSQLPWLDDTAGLASEDDVDGYCGDRNERVYCRNNGYIVSTSSSASSTSGASSSFCIACARPSQLSGATVDSPGFDARIRIVVGSCRWQYETSRSDTVGCKQDEVLTGICPDCGSGVLRCCIVQEPGCAIPSSSPEIYQRWWSPGSSTKAHVCPAYTAVSAVCGYGCSVSCLKLQHFVSARFCMGYYFYDAENIVNPPCARKPSCPTGTIVVGYRTCQGDFLSTGLQCAKLRSGTIKENLCVTISGDSNVWCPAGFVATSVCAPPSPAACDDRHHTTITCCPVRLRYNTVPCTADAGWFIAAGNHDISCDRYGWTDRQNVEGTTLPALKHIAMNNERNVLLAITENENELLKLVLSQYYHSSAGRESVNLADVQSLQIASARVAYVTESSTAIIKKLTLGHSGLLWTTEIAVGNAGFKSGTIRNNSFAKQAMPPMRTSLLVPSTDTLFFSALNAIYSVVALRVTAYVGTTVPATPAVDGVFRTETGLDAATSLAYYTAANTEGEGKHHSLLFFAEADQHVVRFVNTTSGIVYRLSGERGVAGSDPCPLLPSQPQQQGGGGPIVNVKLNTPSALAVHDRLRWLFVADSGSFCIRRYNLEDIQKNMAPTTCFEVGQISCGPVFAAANGNQPFIAAVFGGANTPFSPVSMTLSDTTLYAISRSGKVVYGTLLEERIDKEITQTPSLRVTPSVSESETFQASSTIHYNSTTLEGSTSRSLSSSETGCYSIIPRALFKPMELGNNMTIIELDASHIQLLGVNMSIAFQTCHEFDKYKNISIPTLRYNPTYHVDGSLTSVYGVSRASGHWDGFLQMYYVPQLERYAVQIGPFRKYHPTIVEVIDFVWSKDNLVAASHDVVVTVTIRPTRKSFFEPKYVKSVSYITFLSVISSFLTGMPSATIRASRLMFIMTTSECPLEDKEEALPFSHHPIGIPIGIGLYRYHIGAAVCNTGIMLFLLSVQLLLALLAHLCLASSRTETFVSSLTFVHFPSLQLAPIALLYQPTLTSALKVLWNGSALPGERGERTLAAFIIVFCLSLTAFIVYILLPKNFRAIAKTTSRHSRSNIWFVGKFKWKDGHVSYAGFCARYESIFQEFTPKRYNFMIVEVAFALLLGAISSPSLSNEARCATAHSCIGGLFIVYAILLKIVLPYQSRVKQILFLVSAVADVITITLAYLQLAGWFAIFAMFSLSISALVLFVISAQSIYILIRFESKSLQKWWRKGVGVVDMDDDADDNDDELGAMLNQDSDEEEEDDGDISDGDTDSSDDEERKRKDDDEVSVATSGGGRQRGNSTIVNTSIVQGRLRRLSKKGSFLVPYKVQQGPVFHVPKLDEYDEYKRANCLNQEQIDELKRREQEEADKYNAVLVKLAQLKKKKRVKNTDAEKQQEQQEQEREEQERGGFHNPLVRLSEEERRQLLEAEREEEIYELI